MKLQPISRLLSSALGCAALLLLPGFAAIDSADAASALGQAAGKYKVSFRGTGNDRETVVQFKRTPGDPDSVYFYFNGHGDYAGSNFSGK